MYVDLGVPGRAGPAPPAKHDAARWSSAGDAGQDECFEEIMIDVECSENIMIDV